MARGPHRPLLQPQDLRPDLRILPSLPIVRLEDGERGHPRLWRMSEAPGGLWGTCCHSLDKVCPPGVGLLICLVCLFAFWLLAPPCSPLPLSSLSGNFPLAEPIPASELCKGCSLGRECSFSNFPWLATFCHRHVIPEESLPWSPPPGLSPFNKTYREPSKCWALLGLGIERWS